MTAHDDVAVALNLLAAGFDTIRKQAFDAKLSDEAVMLVSALCGAVEQVADRWPDVLAEHSKSEWSIMREKELREEIVKLLPPQSVDDDVPQPLREFARDIALQFAKANAMIEGLTVENDYLKRRLRNQGG